LVRDWKKSTSATYQKDSGSCKPHPASDLRVGIARSVRMKGFSPPMGVLLEFCRQAPGLHVCGDTIVATERVNPDEVLSQIERQIVHTLCQNGGSLSGIG
jgi:hypothetical protein